MSRSLQVTKTYSNKGDKVWLSQESCRERVRQGRETNAGYCITLHMSMSNRNREWDSEQGQPCSRRN
eukprot:755155-Hanusia_phi.AAC.3